ncbi:hypothetical protein [Streptomyces cupreus]
MATVTQTSDPRRWAADLGATTGEQLGVPQAFSTGGGRPTRTSSSRR